MDAGRVARTSGGPRPGRRRLNITSLCMPTRRLTRRPVVLFALLLAASAGCAGGGNTETTARGERCEFEGGTEARRVERDEGPFQISEVHHEVVQPGCEEQIVFTFESSPDDAGPGYEVFYRDGPFRGPTGEIEVGGNALLEIVLPGSHGGTEAAGAADAELVVDIVKPPEVPGGSLWLVGLGEAHPFTVRFERAPEPALIVAIGAPEDA